MKQRATARGLTLFSLIVLGAAFPLVARVPPTVEQPSAHFELPHDDFLLDDPIPIVLSGLTPGTTVTIDLHAGTDNAWASKATFTVGPDGRVDLARMAPTSGSYKGVDAMGLFWSTERAGAYDASESSPSDRWTLTASVGDAMVAQQTIRRRALAADVRVTNVRTDGLVGTFYEPSGGGRHPAIIVLGGSGGGIPPAAGPAGGLASHGYAVLALAYFGVEGLPPVLSNIRLEYFGTALRWLATQPSVDTTRLGVLGVSRGAELALLLGVTYPGAFHTVIAYLPSNVIWRGCCDPSTMVAWTMGGRAVAPRTEIPVENIHGAVFLVSGKDDGVWESAAMAGAIVARLKRHDFTYPVESLTYDNAGHAIGRPYTSTMNLNGIRHPISGRVMHLGGTPAGTAKARADSWPKMLAFVDRNLRGSAATH